MSTERDVVVLTSILGDPSTPISRTFLVGCFNPIIGFMLIDLVIRLTKNETTPQLNRSTNTPIKEALLIDLRLLIHL